MSAPVEQRKDEKFSFDLLEKYFINKYKMKINLEINSEDPPDLLLKIPNGKIFGIEVVRIYTLFKSIGSEKSVPSEQVITPLEKFAEEIKDITSDIRKRKYYLFFEGQTALSSWTASARKKSFLTWKQETLEAICAHIVKDTPDRLRGPGYTLKAVDSGNSLSFVISDGVREIAPALNLAIQRVFDAKADALPRWRVECSKRWLLMLDCTLFAENSIATEQIHHLLASREDNNFDGVFWSGYPERELVEISLSPLSWAYWHG